MENFYKAFKVIKISDAYKRNYRYMFSWHKSENVSGLEKVYETFNSVYTNSCLSFENWQSLFLNDSWILYTLRQSSWQP